MGRVDGLGHPAIFIALPCDGDSLPRASLFTRRGLTATSACTLMLFDAAVASEVISVISAVSPTTIGTRFDDGPAFFAGMALYGGEKVVKSIK